MKKDKVRLEVGELSVSSGALDETPPGSFRRPQKRSLDQTSPSASKSVRRQLCDSAFAIGRTEEQVCAATHLKPPMGSWNTADHATNTWGKTGYRRAWSSAALRDFDNQIKTRRWRTRPAYRTGRARMGAHESGANSKRRESWEPKPWAPIVPAAREAANPPLKQRVRKGNRAHRRRGYHSFAALVETKFCAHKGGAHHQSRGCTWRTMGKALTVLRQGFSGGLV